jgi:hypothetical protein
MFIGAFRRCQTTANGFSTFDLADIYGPAEDYVGAFSKGSKTKDLAKECNVRGQKIICGGLHRLSHQTGYLQIDIVAHLTCFDKR